MLATITRPWIGRRSRPDGLRRRRGGCGPGGRGSRPCGHRVLGGALAGRTVPACSPSSSGGWTSQQRPVGERPRPWFPSRRDPDDRGGRGAHPTRTSPGRCGVSAAALGARLGGGRGRLGPQRLQLKSTRFHLDPRQGPVPGGWSAASTPPGGRSSGPRPARRAWDPGRRSGSPGSAGGRPRRTRAPRLSLSAVSAVAGTVATVRPAPAVGAWSSYGASDRADAPVDVRAGAGQQVELGGPVPAPQLPGPGPGLHLRPLRDRTPVGDWGNRP
jgi:hypothetical protein